MINLFNGNQSVHDDANDDQCIEECSRLQSSKMQGPRNLQASKMWNTTIHGGSKMHSNSRM